MSEKKKIMILGKLPPPYMGPSIATEILLKSGLKNSFDIIHVDTKINSDLNNIGKWSFKKLTKNIRIYRDMISKIKNHNPEMILIPISQSTVGFIKDSVFIIIAGLYKKKVLLHLRGSDFKTWFLKTNPLTKFYVKQRLKSTCGVIVLGQNLRYLFSDFYPADKIFVSSNGGDYNIPARTRTDDSKVRVLYLGNLQSSKGIEDVIEAASLLQEKHKNTFELEVIGGWRNESVKEQSLEKVETGKLPVSFFPPEISKNKLQHLANADIFVFPPRAPEGHPWVIVEAMAAGLPIISTDKGAIVESVKHNENGFIVSSASPQEIAARIAELTDNPGLRKRMGAESRKKYLAQFTEQKMVENLTTIFNTVINN